MLLYYITDRTQFTGTESQRRERVLEKIAEAAMTTVYYVQLREKDLPGRALESLAQPAHWTRRVHASRESARVS